MMTLKSYQCNQCQAKFFEDLGKGSSVDGVPMTCPLCGSTKVEEGTVDSRDILMLADVESLYPALGIPRG